MTKLRLLGSFLFLWVFVAGSLYFASAIFSVAHAEKYNLDLARIVLSNDGIEHDSYVDSPGVSGFMAIETDESNIVRSIFFDAWFVGEANPLISDTVEVSSYTANGARYWVRSFWSDAEYFISFLRRAPPGDGYDPAVVFLVSLDDGSMAILDYRYIPHRAD